MSLYTREIESIMHQFKHRLPKDFSLVTEEREVAIIIIIPMSNFAWRTVEDRLDIAVKMEELCNAIKSKGVPCFIEKM